LVPPFSSNCLKQKSRPTKDSSFGSSAIFPLKTRRFPLPSYGGFGFIGIHLYQFAKILSIFLTKFSYRHNNFKNQ